MGAAAADPAYQALASKLAETQAPGGWRAFRALVPGAPATAAAAGAGAGAGEAHHGQAPAHHGQAAVTRPLDAVAALRPAELTRREWAGTFAHSVPVHLPATAAAYSALC